MTDVSSDRPSSPSLESSSTPTLRGVNAGIRQGSSPSVWSHYSNPVPGTPYASIPSDVTSIRADPRRLRTWFREPKQDPVAGDDEDSDEASLNQSDSIWSKSPTPSPPPSPQVSGVADSQEDTREIDDVTYEPLDPQSAAGSIIRLAPNKPSRARHPPILGEKPDFEKKPAPVSYADPNNPIKLDFQARLLEYLAQRGPTAMVEYVRREAHRPKNRDVKMWRTVVQDEKDDTHWLWLYVMQHSVEFWLAIVKGNLPWEFTNNSAMEMYVKTLKVTKKAGGYYNVVFQPGTGCFLTPVDINLVHRLAYAYVSNITSKNFRLFNYLARSIDRQFPKKPEQSLASSNNLHYRRFMTNLRAKNFLMAMADDWKERGLDKMRPRLLQTPTMRCPAEVGWSVNVEKREEDHENATASSNQMLSWTRSALRSESIAHELLQLQITFCGRSTQIDADLAEIWPTIAAASSIEEGGYNSAEPGAHNFDAIGPKKQYLFDGAAERAYGIETIRNAASEVKRLAKIKLDVDAISPHGRDDLTQLDSLRRTLDGARTALYSSLQKRNETAHKYSGAFSRLCNKRAEYTQWLANQESSGRIRFQRKLDDIRNLGRASSVPAVAGPGRGSDPRGADCDVFDDPEWTTDLAAIVAEAKDLRAIVVDDDDALMGGSTIASQMALPRDGRSPAKTTARQRPTVLPTPFDVTDNVHWNGSEELAKVMKTTETAWHATMKQFDKGYIETQMFDSDAMRWLKAKPGGVVVKIGAHLEAANRLLADIEVRRSGVRDVVQL